MNKEMIDRLVEKRNTLDLPAARELCGEEEARWWVNVIADVLEQRERGLSYCDSFSCDSHRGRSHWLRSEIAEQNKK